jgi:hypothetical protein
MHTHGHIPRTSLDAWKQMLLLVNSSLDRESLDILLFMHKFQQKTLDVEREWEKWRTERDTESESLRANPNTTQKQLQDHEQKWQQIEPTRSREHPLRVSGDGLLRLVRLIRTGLVEEGEQQADYGDHFLAFYYWEPSLTSIGKTLADAFLNGDADAFRSILQGHELKK